MYKAGANKIEVAKIARMAAMGDSAKTISKALKIEEKSVESFMPKKKKGGK